MTTQSRIRTIGAGALVAVAAGLAASLLFVLAARGSFLTIALGYFAPMPVMIAALGFGLSIGAAAAAIGASFIAIAFHPALGLLYLVTIGAPAALIAAAALLAPAPDDRTGRDQAPTFAVLTTALAAGLAAVFGLVFLSWRAGGYDALVATAIKEGAPLVSDMLKDAHATGSIDAARLTRYLAIGAPIGVAASEVVAMTINFWLAGRVALISGNLPRRWPKIADDLAIPAIFGALFATTCGLAWLGGLPGVISGICAAVLGVVFAFQGLATLHVLTRGSSLRPALLFALYIFVILMPPWPLFGPLLALAVLGLIDAAFHLRARKSAPSQT